MENHNISNEDFDNQATLDAIDQIKKAQRFITIATIAAPVSLFIGGTLLSGIALILGIIGYSKLKKLPLTAARQGEIVNAAMRSARMAMVMCGIALALNVVSMMYMFPAYLELFETGELEALMGGGAGAGGTAAGGGTSSVWG